MRKSTPGMQTHKVSKITRHPQYESLKYANDVAVIRLAQPANFTNFVRPVCLWEGSGDINHLLGKFGENIFVHRTNQSMLLLLNLQVRLWAGVTTKLAN